MYGSLVCIPLQLPLSISYTVLLEFIGSVSGGEEPTLVIFFLHMI